MNRIHAAQLFQHIHGTQFRLVESRLIFVGDQKHLIGIGVKFLCEPIFWEAVQGSLCIFRFIIREFYFAGKGYQSMDALIPLFRNVILKCLPVFHRSLPGRSNDHCFGLSAQLFHNGGAEMLDNDLDALPDVDIMQFYKTGNLAFGCIGLTAGVFFNLLVDLVEGFVFCEVLQHIQNKTLLDCLLHRVDVESLALAFGVQSAKELDGGGFWRSGECKHRDVRLLAVALDFIGDHVLHIAFDRLTSAQSHRHRSHVFTGGGRMGFVDDNGKTLVLQTLYAIHNIGKLLNGGSDDFCVAVQCNRQVGGVALVIHDPDQTGLVLHTHDGLLELAVNHHTVSHNDDIIENDFIVRIMQRSQPVRQPSDGVCLAGTGAVLDQVVLRSAIHTDISEKFTDDIQLVVARKNQVL